MKTFTLAALAVLSAPAVLAQASAAAKAPPPAAGTVREFKSVNIEVKGNKIWTPSVFIVKKGEQVRITLINTAPSGVHAFTIEGYGVDVAVNNAEGANTKTASFTADKAGLFRIYCSMHPAHVGGQLLVLE